MALQPIAYFFAFNEKWFSGKFYLEITCAFLDDTSLFENVNWFSIVFVVLNNFEKAGDNNLNILNIFIHLDVFELLEEQPGESGSHVFDISLQIDYAEDGCWFGFDGIDVGDEDEFVIGIVGKSSELEGHGKDETIFALSKQQPLVFVDPFWFASKEGSKNVVMVDGINIRHYIVDPQRQHLLAAEEAEKPNRQLVDIVDLSERGFGKGNGHYAWLCVKLYYVNTFVR